MPRVEDAMWYWPIAIVIVIISTLAVAVELVIVARRDRDVRPWAIVVAVSALAIPLAIVLHNVASAFIAGEEGVSFIVALLVTPAGFAIGAIGAAVVTARRERVLGGEVGLAGAGMALFALYTLFALVVTAIEGGNPSYQGAIEIVIVPVAALSMLGGAIAAAVTLIGRRSVAV